MKINYSPVLPSASAERTGHTHRAKLKRAYMWRRIYISRTNQLMILLAKSTIHYLLFTVEQVREWWINMKFSMITYTIRNMQNFQSGSKLSTFDEKQLIARRTVRKYFGQWDNDNCITQGFMFREGREQTRSTKVY